jgi:DNA-binding XRE family transcriptional regulator
MTDTIKLEIALIQKGKTKKDLAHLLKVSLQTIYNKVNNLVDFKTQEVKAITEFLGLNQEQMVSIFFAENVE